MNYGIYSLCTIPLNFKLRLLANERDSLKIVIKNDGNME